MTESIKKKLIEVAIPLEVINAASAREKSIRHGHPSTLHLWWARRPLAACRAVLFAQLVDDDGAVLVWDDGLWVDPATLWPGDVFMQRHLLPVPAGSTPQALLVGLYDPFTGERVRLENGRDHMRLELNSPAGPQSSLFLRP